MYFEEKELWTKCTVDEALRSTGRKPISVRWVDVSKGNDLFPNYRSRLFSRDIKKKGDTPMFARTPPLEALRTILGMAGTKECWPQHIWNAKETSEDRMQVSFTDIARAYFNARIPSDQPIYVDLLAADERTSEKACVLACEYTCMARDLRRKAGTRSSQVSSKASERSAETRPDEPALRGPWERLHYLGPKAFFDCFKKELQRHYELKKSARSRLGEQDDKEASVSDRVVHWTLL